MGTWLKLKVRKFFGVNPTFVEGTGEKLVWGGGGGLPPMVNRVNEEEIAGTFYENE